MTSGSLPCQLRWGWLAIVLGALLLLNLKQMPDFTSVGAAAVDPLPVFAFTNLSATVHQRPIESTGRLWLHVQTYAEGMGCWRRAFAEVLLVAKALNATLVEPCIKRGRLVSCSDIMPKKRLAFGDMFVMQEIQRIHPLIVAQDQFDSLVDPTIITWCMHTGSPSVDQVCTCDSVLLKNFHGQKDVRPLDRAVRRHDQQLGGDTIMDIYLYRKGAFLNAQFEGQPLMSIEERDRIVESSYKFRPEQHAVVDTLLKKLGITSEFNVIHWRAELEPMNYKKCVKQLIQSKGLLSGNTTTVLMSSLNADEKKQWKRSDRAHEQNKSLVTLMNAGYVKLDSIVNKSNDLFHLAAWDLILAQKANRFATCTEACDKERACAACNHRGSFAATAIGYRSQVGRRSEECWPE